MPPLCRDDDGGLVACVDASGRLRPELSDRAEVEVPDVLLEGRVENLRTRRHLFGWGGKRKATREDLDINTFSQGDVGPLDLGIASGE